jgi:hypothetical protein
MTTVMLVLGMLPIALGAARARASRASIARVIIGGQALSLVITLLVTPVAYSLFDDLGHAPPARGSGGCAEAPRASCAARPAASVDSRVAPHAARAGLTPRWIALPRFRRMRWGDVRTNSGDPGTPPFCSAWRSSSRRPPSHAAQPDPSGRGRLRRRPHADHVHEDVGHDGRGPRPRYGHLGITAVAGTGTAQGAVFVDGRRAKAALAAP